MKTNTKRQYTGEYTHEGGKAARLSLEHQLRRSVMACMLWEKSFYEEGQSIVDRIASLIKQIDPVVVANMAIEARTAFKLRHVPLLLTRELARKEVGYPVASTLTNIIQRPDEIAEFISIYWNGKKTPLSSQVKKGLAGAFYKFNEYQFGKYKGMKNTVSLRDAMFLCHPKPRNADEATLFRKIADNMLETPDTWEVALSSGADKQSTWVRLLAENKLGALALLRNLRNMQMAGVPKELIENAIYNMKTDRVLPFRFIAASQYAPALEPALEHAMLNSLADNKKLSGHTVLLVDVSGSMDWALSSKSDINRMGAATGLAILLREVCENISTFTFSEQLVEVPARRGFALRDVIVRSQQHGGTRLGRAIDELRHKFRGRCDRIVVITDEQSHDTVGSPLAKRGYMINVANDKNGVGYGNWIRISGWSEAIVSYIQQLEEVFGDNVNF